MSKETADLYQEFFDFFSQEHNLHLTIGQMQEILSESQKLESKLNRADVVGLFSQNQSLTLIGEMRKLGVGLKILNNNKWQQLSEYKLPFERFIPLYNDQFKICDIGVY